MGSENGNIACVEGMGNENPQLTQSFFPPLQIMLLDIYLFLISTDPRKIYIYIFLILCI